MVTKNQQIPLIVKSLKRDVLDNWSIYFHRPAHFMFEAGDWIDIYFHDRTLNGGRTYSISSSPTEADIRITFREGLSEIKRALQSVKPGNELYISQYGNDYDFQLNRNQSSMLIAGGIGIAPFRSMVKEMADNDDAHDVTLIYLNKGSECLFRPELDAWAGSLPNVSITYIDTNDINRKKREKLIHSLITNVSQNFYISGPPGMVDANEHLLIDMGVRVRDIRIDSFGGY